MIFYAISAKGDVVEIIEAIWFTEMGSGHTIGIVMGVDEITGKPKAYIGGAPGYDEAAEMKSIAERGAKLHPAVATRVAAYLSGGKA